MGSSLTMSADSSSGFSRQSKQSRKPTILITNTSNDSTEAEDDFNDDFDDQSTSPISARHRCSIAFPQMELTSGTVVEMKVRQLSKSPELSLGGRSGSSHENEKGKPNDWKNKLSQQHMSFCNTEVEFLSNTHRFTEALPSLTSAQIHLIRNIWRQVYLTRGPTVIGSTLMHGIFFKSKKIKYQFFKCPTPRRFPNCDSFNKAHAKVVGEMLDKIVDNLENLESLSGYLFVIGAMHANLAQEQVTKEIWNLMAETFIDCTLIWGDKKGRTEASRKAWAFIISFVTHKIKRGFLHERRRLAFRRQSATTAPFQTKPSIPQTSCSAPTIRFWESVEEFDSRV